MAAKQQESLNSFLIGDTHILGAAALSQVGVLGANAGVVQAGRNRVGLFHLAVIGAHQE